MGIPNKATRNRFKMPVLGLGTWLLGGDFSQDPTRDEKADIESIQRAIDQGISHIDTAEIYAGGYTERLVSKGIKPFKRENLFIATKVWDTNLRYNDLLYAAQQSLQRLETNYLDLYYVHKPNPQISLKETIKAMEKLVDEGFVRHIGLSNFAAERIETAQAYTHHKISVVQAHFNLIFREPEANGLINYCIENDILLVAWRPLECGVLCNTQEPLMRDLSKKLKKTPAQIAINWLISQRNVVTISTMISAKHLNENLNALNWQLSKENVSLLRDAFPKQRVISNAVPLS